MKKLKHNVTRVLRGNIWYSPRPPYEIAAVRIATPPTGAASYGDHLSIRFVRGKR